MIRTVGFVPCEEFLQRGEQPTVMYRRERDREADGGRGFTAAKVGYGDAWYVVSKAVSVEGDPSMFRLAEPPDVAKVQHEELVRIPLFRYVVPGRDLRLVYGFAAQIGAAAALSLPSGKQVLQLHLALGDVRDRPADNECEFYFGIAFRCQA